jgi:hypothetical protein
MNPYWLIPMVGGVAVWGIVCFWIGNTRFWDRCADDISKV